ncbi:flagellar biosynthesis protein FlhF [Tumebacillus lipolyticus]|uniref:Flagellar biosynthesis protein FlhF n=1 Tax=Tumebacillus lipolyticus TaxID=1280370 RepID=A0ABW5A061_9BACL
MLVKRYLVKEMPEAVAMIREDLGKDAVILSTKKVQKRGFFGLFPKTHIEVVAAANEEQSAPSAPQPQPFKPRPTATNAYQLQMGQAAQNQPPTQERPESAAPAAVRNERSAASLGQLLQKQGEAASAIPALGQQGAEAVLAADAGSAIPPLSKQGVAQAPSVQAEEQVLREVQELRTMFRNLLHTSPQQLVPDSVINVRKQLIQQDISEQSVDRLIERGIRNFAQVHEVSEQEFRGVLTNFIREDLDRYSPPSQIALKTRVVAFIGPTGVGKTTTIAKLAAEQVLTKGKKVGLITTDTYRIAAVEQLRTYANILGIPLQVCYAPEDIKRAMGAFSDFDLILIDTAGRNYQNLLNVQQLNAYLEEIQPDETYLVLSLTTKAADLEAIVSNFAQVRADKFLFTKSDETRTFGAVYNLVTQFQKPLSYMTTGQNVPEDIEAISTESLAILLTGEVTHE